MEPPPRLIALSDTDSWPQSIEALCELCKEARPGAVAVILRDRTLAVRVRHLAGERLREVTRETGQRFLVADRLDLMRLLGADGVHLPADGVPPAVARKAECGIVSRAGHGLLELGAEDRLAPDWALVSPACAPRKGRPALGLLRLSARLKAFRSASPSLSLFALGGVNGQNARDCLKVGADGVAVIGAAMTEEGREGLLSSLEIAR